MLVYQTMPPAGEFKMVASKRSACPTCNPLEGKDSESATQVTVQLLEGFNDIECGHKSHKFIGRCGGQRFEGSVIRRGA